MAHEITEKLVSIECLSFSSSLQASQKEASEKMTEMSLFKVTEGEMSEQKEIRTTSDPLMDPHPNTHSSASPAGRFVQVRHVF